MPRSVELETPESPPVPAPAPVPEPEPEPEPAPEPAPAPEPTEVSFDEAPAAADDEDEEDFDFPSPVPEPDDDDDDDFDVPDLDDIVMPEMRSKKAKPKRGSKARGGRRGAAGGGRRIGLIVGWVVLMVIIVGVAAGGLFGRDMIIAAWPPAAKLYETIGLGDPEPGFGLALGDIKSSQKQEGGKNILIITGTISNISEAPQPVPKLRGALLDAKRKPIHDWIFDPPKAQLGAAEKTEFSTRVPNPPATARGLAVTFMERMPEDGGKMSGKAKPAEKPAEKKQ